MDQRESAPESPKIDDLGECKINTALTPRKPVKGQMVQSYRDTQVSDLTIDMIKQYICPKASDDEAFMFLKLCQARGLNPFLKEAYLVKYSNESPATLIIGKDAFTKRAEAHPQFDGFKAGIIVQNESGLDYREGTFLMPNETLVGGWADVFRKDRSNAFKAAVSRKDFDTGKSVWAKMPAVMIRKVALVSALREGFPSEFSGCYDASEMGLDPDKEIREV